MQPSITTHLVGSVPLQNSRDVFETTAQFLGVRAPRLPDGETCERIGFVTWQRKVFEEHPALEMAETISHTHSTGVSYQNFQLKGGVNIAEVTFPDLGYASAAIESFAVFRSLKADGKIPAGTRFQVSLPTALDITWGFVVQAQRELVHAPVQNRLHEEIAQICAAIPHDELSIQIDVCHEILILENAREPFFSDRDRMIPEVARTADQVPGSVEIGFHLCYGDGGHKHTVEPKDMALLVRVMNGISEKTLRKIDYFHAPVPRERDDEPYFAPLKNLDLKRGTEVILGLVHFTDGLRGTMRRINTARRILPSFGIATECGLGRRPPETIPELLEIHAEAADLLSKMTEGKSVRAWKIGRAN